MTEVNWYCEDDGVKVINRENAKDSQDFGLKGQLPFHVFGFFFSFNKLNQCSKTAFCIHSGYIKFASKSENVTKNFKKKEFEDKTAFNGTYIKMTWIWNFMDFVDFKAIK